MRLTDNINTLKGIGPKLQSQFNKCGIFTLMDLILYFPRDYERVGCLEEDALNGSSSKVMMEGEAVSIKSDSRIRGGRIISTVVFNCNGEEVYGRWFNQPYIKNKFIVGCSYLLMGKLDTFKGKTYIINPIIKNASSTVMTDDSQKTKYKVISRYPLKGELTNNIIIKFISIVLQNISIVENMPIFIIEKFKLCSLDQAIRQVHSPEDFEKLNEARKRLKFQELLTYSLKILMYKDYLRNNNVGIEFKISPELSLLKEKLPFELTKSQSRVIREILIDEKKSKAMNRLVQGDVGSGKTIVAIIAMFNIVKNGYQAVLMAPTEILAKQHYLEVTKVLESFNINVELLCGSMTLKKKKEVKEKLKCGDVDIVIGTHALIQEDVEFYNLGLVVTDEQHRFGVMQRSTLFNKGKNVDLLVMTATPIPRTLALYLYGDLEVSIIDELPPGRQKIETLYVNLKERAKVYSFALKEIEKGRQVYIVSPLIEENENLEASSVEELFLELKNNHFKDVEVEVLHGKLSPSAKEEIMQRFKTGVIKAIISTTVIEVGINVPNATVMIIENAERFGLAQLHQLRGRVGRGSFKSYCILIANLKNSMVKRKMEILKNNSDGFRIAEEDLKIRGSGEIIGFRQHGDENFVIADPVEDLELLKYANGEARQIILSSLKESIDFKNSILEKLKEDSRMICFN